MARGRSFLTQSGSYVSKGSHPFAFGRASVFYECESPTGDSVCIKEFRHSPVLADQFFRELSSQRSLSHPNILPILDFGRPRNSSLFLVLPLCTSDLRRFLRSR